ncbi:hypothetical protein CLM71_08680 [Serratia sp. MYb239]|nr:hypothetical protein CLM71_08680 [Serratia sp. MYb239]
MAIGLLLVAVVVAGRIASYYRDNYLQVQKQAEQQKKTLAQQAGLITTLRADDARNRTMMAEQRRREQQLRQQGEIYQRKLRDALKGDKCGNSPMPAAVVELLQQNTVAGTRTGDKPAP